MQRARNLTILTAGTTIAAIAILAMLATILAGCSPSDRYTPKNTAVYCALEQPTGGSAVLVTFNRCSGEIVPVSDGTPSHTEVTVSYTLRNPDNAYRTYKLTINVTRSDESDGGTAEIVAGPIPPLEKTTSSKTFIIQSADPTIDNTVHLVSVNRAN